MGWAEENGQISAGVGPALDRGNGSDKLIAIAKFPTRGDKAVELNPFVAGWRLRGCTFRRVQLGIQRSGRSS